MRVSAFAGVTIFTGSLLAGFLGFFNLRGPKGFGGTVNVSASRIPKKGEDPGRISEGKFWLVNLQGAQGALALSSRASARFISADSM